MSDQVQIIAGTITSGIPLSYIKQCLSNIHPDLLSSSSDTTTATTICGNDGGLHIPVYSISGCRVLYLGDRSICNTLLLSQLVGKNGSVIGIIDDMKKLSNLPKYIQHHTNQVGYNNVEFIPLSDMMASSSSLLSKQSFDLIVGTCVTNLYNNDKYNILNTCYELLKDGGELYISDIYTIRRISNETKNHNTVLSNIYLSNSLYYLDFVHMMKSIGYIDPRLVDNHVVVAAAQQQQQNTANNNVMGEFHMATYRLPKVATLETSCEDYGQAVIYHGTIDCMNVISDGSSSSSSIVSSWKLDIKHIFETGIMQRVCGNTYRIIKENPIISNHFTYLGSFDKHYNTMDGCLNNEILSIKHNIDDGHIDGGLDLNNHDKDVVDDGSFYYTKLLHELLAEAFGTFIITQFGTASVMSAVISEALVGLFQVAVIWFIAVALAILVTAQISGAHLNPAVSIAFAILRPSEKFTYKKVLPYSIAQLFGAFIASLLNYGLYAGRIRYFEDANDLPRYVLSDATITTAKCFGQYKASTVSLWESFFAEVFGTFMLAIIIFATTHPNNKALGVNNNALIPAFAIGMSVAALISTLAPISQGGFNPARDFGPRLVAWIFGWNPTIVFREWWVYIFAPIIGAPLGGIFVDQLLFPTPKPNLTKLEAQSKQKLL